MSVDDDIEVDAKDLEPYLDMGPEKTARAQEALEQVARGAWSPAEALRFVETGERPS